MYMDNICFSFLFSVLLGIKTIFIFFFILEICLNAELFQTFVPVVLIHVSGSLHITVVEQI